MGHDWGFPYDPSVKRGKANLPPEGHIARCRQRKRRTNPPVQCPCWAVRGRDYCKAHGGHLPGKLQHETKVRSYYSQRAGPKLKEKLAELSARAPDGAMSLAGEVEMARVMCERAVRVYEATHFAEVEANKAAPSANVRALAAANLKESLTLVSDVATKCARIQGMMEGVVAVEALDYVISQVVTILERELVHRGHPELVDALCAKFNEIKLPQYGGAASSANPEDLTEQVRQSMQEMRGLRPGGATASESTEDEPSDELQDELQELDAPPLNGNSTNGGTNGRS